MSARLVSNRLRLVIFQGFREGRVRVRVRVRDIQWVFQNEDVFVYKMHDLALSPNLKFKFIHLHEFHNVRCLILVLNCHF